jgi:hypothetical protein
VEELMPDKTSNGGPDLMRVIINLGGVVLATGIVALIVATIVSGT